MSSDERVEILVEHDPELNMSTAELARKKIAELKAERLAGLRKREVDGPARYDDLVLDVYCLLHGFTVETLDTLPYGISPLTAVGRTPQERAARLRTAYAHELHSRSIITDWMTAVDVSGRSKFREVEAP